MDVSHAPGLDNNGSKSDDATEKKQVGKYFFFIVPDGGIGREHLRGGEQDRGRLGDKRRCELYRLFLIKTPQRVRADQQMMDPSGQEREGVIVADRINHIEDDIGQEEFCRFAGIQRILFYTKMSVRVDPCAHQRVEPYRREEDRGDQRR